MSRTSFDADYKTIGRVCSAWWRELRGLDSEGQSKLVRNRFGELVPMPPDRAALAELRRVGVIGLDDGPAVDTGRALGSEAFRKLLGDLRGAAVNGRLLDLEPVAIAAAALAFIRTDASPNSPGCGATAGMLGRPRAEGGSSEDRLFAEARFKRLIRTRDDWPGLCAQARRIAAILEKEAPVGDLAASLILWNAGPRVVRDWAFAYYSLNAAPDAKSAAA